MALAEALIRLGVDVEVFTNGGETPFPLPTNDNQELDHVVLDVPREMPTTSALAEEHGVGITRILDAGTIMVDVGDITRRYDAYKHALLRGGFATHRPDSPRMGPIRRVCVALAGGEHYQRVYETLWERTSNLPAWVKVDYLGGENQNWDAPWEIMSKADLGICSASMTALEFACLGVPVVTYTANERQDEVQKRLVDHGLALTMDSFGDMMDRAGTAHCLNGTMSKRQMTTIDGLGADRAAEIILSSVSAPQNPHST